MQSMTIYPLLSLNRWSALMGVVSLNNRTYNCLKVNFVYFDFTVKLVCEWSPRLESDDLFTDHICTDHL